MIVKLKLPEGFVQSKFDSNELLIGFSHEIHINFGCWTFSKFVMTPNTCNYNIYLYTNNWPQNQ